MSNKWQKGHNDSGVLLCIVSKNDRGNNNYDEEDYMEYVKKHFIPVWCAYILSVWEHYPSMYDCISNTINIHILRPYLHRTDYKCKILRLKSIECKYKELMKTAECSSIVSQGPNKVPAARAKLSSQVLRGANVQNTFPLRCEMAIGHP